MTPIERIRAMAAELSELAAALYRPGGSAEHDAAVRARDGVLWLMEILDRAKAVEALAERMES